MRGTWREFWEHHAETVGSDRPYDQVLRVENRQPVTDQRFTLVAEHAIHTLEPHAGHAVLDLCCGNGLLAEVVERRCRRVFAVDFCERLLREVATRTTGRTFAILGDARALGFAPGSFDRILLAAALQHFEPSEVVRLFRRAAELLRPGGVFLVTDIPDASRIWRFFDSVEREDACFDAIERESPILGNWFHSSWLTRLARHAGFRDARVIEQPRGLPYSRYRFDLRCAV